MNPIQNNLTPAVPAGFTPSVAAAGGAEGGGEFADLFMRQLQEVSQAQAEADQGIQRMLTGQSDNLGEVFVATRKAEVAFSLLMELRNKLVDAYEELRQLRV